MNQPPSLLNMLLSRHTRRREFLCLVGGTTASWPLAAYAQQLAIPVIGYLGGASPSARYLAAFRQGLKQTGFVEGNNVVIEFRWAEGQYDRLPALAAILAHQQVAAIIAVAGGNTPAQAAKAVTATIPIVFVSGGDPVKAGLVASLNRPGGNVTGVSVITTELGSKRLELLHQLVPKATKIGVIVNPNYADAERQRRELQQAAGAMKQKIEFANAGTERDIDTAFATLLRNGTDALLVANDAFFTSRRDQLVALAAHYSIPAIFPLAEFSVAGGLISYGANFSEGYRQAGVYTGQILKGAKPRDLPVLQSTKFEIVLNLRTAKALGLAIPDKVLALADEVIE